MQQGKFRYAMLMIPLTLLLLVRGFEDSFFYDPFLGYFRGSFENRPLPDFDTGLLAANLLLRYAANAALSIWVIWIVFRDSGFVRLSLLLYGVLFILLIASFFAVLFWQPGDFRMILFYIRRFLIQPLFLLIFLPGFYFQLRTEKK